MCPSNVQLLYPRLGTYVPRGYIAFDWKLKMSVASETPKCHIYYAPCSIFLGLNFLKLDMRNTLPMDHILGTFFKFYLFSHFGGGGPPAICLFPRYWLEFPINCLQICFNIFLRAFWSASLLFHECLYHVFPS